MEEKWFIDNSYDCELPMSSIFLKIIYLRNFKHINILSLCQLIITGKAQIGYVLKHPLE
jgi:hypothetical protein